MQGIKLSVQSEQRETCNQDGRRMDLITKIRVLLQWYRPLHLLGWAAQSVWCDHGFHWGWIEKAEGFGTSG